MGFDPTQEITPGLVREAAEKAGVTLESGSFYDRESRCACGLGALVLAYGEKGESALGSYVVSRIAESLGIHEFRAWGFIYGFDDRSNAEGLSGDHWDRGYAEGRRCREALLPATA